MELKTILIEKEKLIAHGNWTEDLQQLLLGLHRYEVAVVDISCTMPESLSMKNCLLIADCQASMEKAKEWEVAVLGYEVPDRRNHHDAIQSYPDMVVEGFDEVDFYFLERVYQRFHHLPWTVIETERCYLREVTLEDLDDLYDLYRPEEITEYMDGLFEDREKEEEYTKAYIENMYRFYGYGLWVVIEKESKRLIGRAGLSHLEVDGEVQLEMGYVIGKDKQKQGYATEVCEGILRYVTETLDFPAVYCLIQEENVISVHLAKKLGFQWDKTVICNGKEMQRYVKILQFK